MFQVGRVCIKVAGRDAGKKCVVVKQESSLRVRIDGETRRRSVSINHLEPTTQILSLKEDASSQEIAQETKELGWKVVTTKKKQAQPRPKRMKSVKSAPSK